MVMGLMEKAQWLGVKNMDIKSGHIAECLQDHVYVTWQSTSTRHWLAKTDTSKDMAPTMSLYMLNTRPQVRSSSFSI